MREPLDTDVDLPVVLDRDAAATRLLELLPADLVDAVWDELIAPLYDARAMSVGWSRGACRRCRVPHSGYWGRLPGMGRPDVPWPGHRMFCPKYAGPLEHKVVRSHDALFGLMLECACGASWYQYDADGNRQEECPKAAESWRGPAPVEEAQR